MRQWQVVLGLLGLFAVVSPSAYGQNYQQNYTNWTYEPEAKRYTCHYEFTPAPQAPIKKQVVVYYPTKPDFVYYYSPEKKTYWGRCAAPSHPSYREEQMQWSFYKENKWGQLSDTCPPIPTSNGGPQIAPPPHPPLSPPAPPGFEP